MAIFTNVVLALVAGVLLLGVIGEKDKSKSRDLALCFAAVMATIIAHNTIM